MASIRRERRTVADEASSTLPPATVRFLPMTPVTLTCPPAARTSWATVPEILILPPRRKNVSIDLPVHKDLSGKSVNVAVYRSRYFGQ
jgi:hypothetical protein